MAWKKMWGMGEKVEVKLMGNDCYSVEKGKKIDRMELKVLWFVL